MCLFVFLMMCKYLSYVALLCLMCVFLFSYDGQLCRNDSHAFLSYDFVLCVYIVLTICICVIIDCMCTSYIVWLVDPTNIDRASALTLVMIQLYYYILVGGFRLRYDTSSGCNRQLDIYTM